jgi:chemotaxis protein MotA
VDKATLGGLLLAQGGIFLGLILEGGNVGQSIQPTAAMIVFGGTLGAVLINFPMAVVWSAFLRLAHMFREPGTMHDPRLKSWCNTPTGQGVRESFR